MEQWLGTLAAQYGYLGIFFVSLIGSLSIVFHIPYTILIFTFGRILNPWLVAVAAGVDSAVGEISGYVLGYLGRAVVSKERQRKMDCFLNVFRRHGAITVFLFALTPLPDDLLIIPLGIIHYSFAKTIIPCILGKVLMSFIIAYDGYLRLGYIENIFSGEGGTVTAIFFTCVLALIVLAIYKIDWEKYFPPEPND